jgi:hypothetical protein
MENKLSIKEIIIKTLFIIGVIIIISVLAFAVIRIVPQMFSGIASVGNAITSPFTNKNIKILANDSEINSNETVLLSWDHTSDETGLYSLKYSCVENVSIKILNERGTRNILCNTNFNLADEKEAELVMILDKENTFVDVPIEINFVNSETDSIDASGKITISMKNDSRLSNNGDIPQNGADSENASNRADISTEEIEGTTPAPTTTAPRNTNTPSTVNIVRTPADLLISNVSVTRNSISFNAQNIGGTTTGSWIFSYLIPNESVQYSAVQNPLRSGEGIRYTLNFSQEFYTGTAIINLNATNSFYEANKNNNFITFNVSGRGSGSDSNDYDSRARTDLEISDLEVGYISGNRFIENETIYERDEFAIKFIVKNIGGQNTGSWRFKVSDLPIRNESDYISDRQNSISPGEAREIIVRFDYAEIGSYRVRVELDPDNDIREEDERNNIMTRSMRVR